MQTLSSPIGVKFQITLPKKVREALGIRRAGELLGFLVDGSKVTLTKAEVVPQGRSFTAREWAKLVRLSEGSRGRTRSAKEYLRRHRRLVRR